MATQAASLTPRRAARSEPRLPGPDGGWWTQLGLVRRDFLGFLTHAADHYGDIFCIRPSPFNRIVVLNSAALAREVLLERPEDFSKSSQTRFMVGKFLGNGLVLSEGKDHATQRRTLQPSFGARALGAMAAPIHAETSRMTATWEASTLVDVEPAMTALSMRIILSFLVGSESETAALEGEDGRAFRDFADAIGGRFRSMPLPAWMPTAGNRREAAAIRQVDRLVARLLETSARSPEGRGILSSLASGIAKQELSFQQARDHIVTLLFAGHETVAKLMSWTLYLLARNPGAQDLVRADGEGLRATSNVVREAMRLYPPRLGLRPQPRRRASAAFGSGAVTSSTSRRISCIVRPGTFPIPCDSIRIGSIVTPPRRIPAPSSRLAAAPEAASGNPLR